MSTIAKTEELITLVPLELLQEVKSLFRLCSQRNGTLDKQELATLVSYLGLDWSHDDVKAFMGSGSKDCLAFMCAFVRNIEQARERSWRLRPQLSRAAAAASPGSDLRREDAFRP